MLCNQWLPQAQFASGYYMAVAKGIYTRYGLSVTIVNGSPGLSSFHHLQEGKTDFVTMFLVTGIRNRAAGVKLVNIAQIVQSEDITILAVRYYGQQQDQEYR
ncbi:ABC transporter substrate-binding protein [candidate division CSSED10-310 bacterium]|uniref:ABC transporter substrate-binding protein n=1 Tax=candidate division CSSED10-310 bacterium TaxID=2855610 RepID=A0ABV6Z4A5_UNCC1